MTKIERVALLHSKRDYLYLFITFALLLSFSLLHEYYNYKKLTKFDSQLIEASVLKQYKKNKHQILKLKSSDGFSFYTTAPIRAPSYKGKDLQMEIWAGNITFLEYLKGFFAFSKILQIKKSDTTTTKFATAIAKQHTSHETTAIYEALFLAKPLPYHLQQVFSNLGISHLLAISGFHLSVLSAILFFLIKYPYEVLQKRFFPYRSAKRDSFALISLLLFSYMIFLDMPASLLRSFSMLLLAFILYDKGIKIISMQTLLLTALFLVALFPRLLFSLGFFLSLSGVFYIFLFLHYFENKSKVWQFLFLPFWEYLMMLPYSLIIFGNFSLYHPLSILLTSLFTLFYPLSIFLHLIGLGDLLDGAINFLINLDPHAIKFYFPTYLLSTEVLLSFLAIFKKEALYLLLVYNLSMFIYSIYHIAQL